METMKTPLLGKPDCYFLYSSFPSKFCRSIVYTKKLGFWYLSINQIKYTPKNSMQGLCVLFSETILSNVLVKVRCKNGAENFTRESRKIYPRLACILAPRTVYLRCLKLQVILPATAGIFDCSFCMYDVRRARWSLPASYMKLAWGAANSVWELQAIFPVSRRFFFRKRANRR